MVILSIYIFFYIEIFTACPLVVLSTGFYFADKKQSNAERIEEFILSFDFSLNFESNWTLQIKWHWY